MLDLKKVHFRPGRASKVGGDAAARGRKPSDIGRHRSIFLASLSKRSLPDRLVVERGASAGPALRSKAMQYLLMIHSDEKAMQAYTQEETGSILAAYGAYIKAMADAGVSKGGQRLHPTSTATTVRVKNGNTQVLNGPYAEIKEQLGGYFLIDVPDLDAAISWAARCPGAQYGAIEVRPIWQM
jgi:hypothetical protein